MKRTALSLSSLIISIILLVTGNALLMTLVGLRLSVEGFSSSLIGWILVFYSVGFVLGTLYAGRVISRVGHIRAFAVFGAALAASILLYPMWVDAYMWGALRALGGFSMAGLMIVMESWFSSRATNSTRAQLFAVYQVVFFLSTAGGQLLINLGDPSGYIPFSLAAILVTLALIPLGLTRQHSPALEEGPRKSLRVLYQQVPVGTLGALVAGLLISAFYTMGPVYANEIGLAVDQLSVFMAIAIVSAMVLAWPIGRLCDYFNRRTVMLYACAIAGGSSLMAALVGGFNIMPLLIAFVGLYMGLGAALYPIAVAITNDLMRNEEITAASTTLLLSYGIGSCLGPIVGALFMGLLGPAGLFVGNALVLGLLCLFILSPAGQMRPVSVEEQAHYYTITPEASVGLAELDPRNESYEEPEHSEDDMDEDGPTERAQAEAEDTKT